MTCNQRIGAYFDIAIFIGLVGIFCVLGTWPALYWLACSWVARITWRVFYE